MKIFSTLLIALSSFLIAQATLADESMSTGGSGKLENVFPLNEAMSLPDFAERLTTPQGSDVHSSYTCRAWTTCWDGRQISCWSRGYRCYSEVTPGYRVYCSATSYYGYTRYWVYYCY